MKHIQFTKDLSKLKIAILIKTTALNKIKLERYYINPSNLDLKNFIAFNLEYDKKGKCPAALAKEHIKDILPEINDLDVSTLIVCDVTYFKFLTKNKKAEPFYGYVCPCAIKNFEHINIILCPNYQAVIFNPNLQKKIDQTLETLEQHIAGIYTPPGQNIIHYAGYPYTVVEIQETLKELHKYPELTCDIETRSLEFWNCGLSSIAFAWDKHNGVAFGIERTAQGTDEFIHRDKNEVAQIKKLLLNFLISYKGKLIYHNAGYDCKILVYELWMEHLSDYAGMLEGINVLTQNFDDSKLITYFATNNTIKNTLKLKPLSASYTGDYAENTKNTELIPFSKLLKYNLIDVLATWYVKNKYEPIMDKDNQREIYENIFKPSVKTLLQTELCGMPINPKKVQIAKKQLTKTVNECKTFFQNNTLIQNFHKEEKKLLAKKKTSKAKKKVYTIDDSIIDRFEFNPSSDTQLRRLLYNYLEYPVLDLTKSKQPSCSGKTLKKLKTQADNPEHIKIFEHLKNLTDANIILTTFIPAMENVQQLKDGSYRLFGNFNLGSTQSLRLSSSKPNLQNIPSGSIHAKIIKNCFEPIKNWLFIGSDFAALESKINALLTRDPNQLKVFTDGYDSHSMNCQNYWAEDMPDINPNSVKSINSIKTKYKVFRQKSKAVSFALQYGGTYMTLMNNSGFSEDEAKRIETRYHKLYKVADTWVQNLIEEAKNIGYIPLAFGGRIRTPLLAKTVGKGKSTPFAVKAEGRSAGNAATQSYCILTMRAFNEFMERVWKSPYKYSILPSGTVHDSIYLVIHDSAEILKWVNDNLIDCMAWQELDELKHPTVKISSSLEVYWPSWAHTIEIPNKASKNEIKSICANAQK